MPDIILHASTGLVSFRCDPSLAAMVGDVSSDGEWVTVVRDRVQTTHAHVVTLADLARETLGEVPFGGVDPDEEQWARRRVWACDSLLSGLHRFIRWESETCDICGSQRPAPWQSWAAADCRC